MFTFKVTYSRNGISFKEEIEAETYKIESTSSKHVTFFRGEQPVGTFFDVDNVMAVNRNKVPGTKKMEGELDELISKNPQSPFLKNDDDDPYAGLYAQP